MPLVRFPNHTEQDAREYARYDGTVISRSDRNNINNNNFFTSPKKSSFTPQKAFTLAEVLVTLGIIGIVAAMTLPAVVGNYQKKVTVERLKKVYSELSQAVLYSVKDNDEIEYWDFDGVDAQEFMERYLLSYLKKISVANLHIGSTKSKSYRFANGTVIQGWLWHNPLVKGFLQIEVDINGDKKPNVYGRDKFIFHIFSQKAEWYNGGDGHVSVNIPKGGFYPDGFGYSRETLLNDSWRGCHKINDETPKSANYLGAFCTALIMLDGWEIKKDYNW